MHRFPVGPTWDALFIYQYRDLEARRDAIIAKVRRTLVNDPVWKQLHDTKQSIRTETENTIADSLAASR
jgi:hypothetical protein